MRTLPEPSNFNLCWTGLSLTEPLRIRGEMPPARINSITIYPRGSNDPPVTLDLSSLSFSSPPQVDRLRIIDIILLPTTPSATTGDECCSFTFEKNSRCGILRYPNHWTSGFIAMRNFCVPNGTRVVTPVISCLSDGKVLRESEILIAGITSLFNLELIKIQRVAVLNATMFLLCRLCDLSPELILFLLICGLFISSSLYRSLYGLGQRGLSKHMTEIAPHPHVFALPDIHKASQASQPSLDHRYWVMRYDLLSTETHSGGEGCDLLIQFNIQRNYQKYWSVVVYDPCGLPIPQFCNLENIIHLPQNATNAPALFDETDSSRYLVTIRLTRSPPKSCTDSSLVVPSKEEQREGTGESVGTAYGTIDLQQVPVGFVIFRLVHPTSEEAVRYSAPRVSLTAPYKPK
jgi:hypothetical protein